MPTIYNDEHHSPIFVTATYAAVRADTTGNEVTYTLDVSIRAEPGTPDGEKVTTIQWIVNGARTDGGTDTGGKTSIVTKTSVASSSDSTLKATLWIQCGSASNYLWQNQNVVLPAGGNWPISFVSNGGSGTMASKQKNYNLGYSIPSCSFTPPAGKRFSHWRGNNNVDYSPGDSYTTNAALTLTAQWVNANIPVYGNVGGVVKQVEKAYANIGGTVKEVTVYTNVGGVIKELV